MFYIIFVIILFLLIVCVHLQSKEHERWLWFKIIVIYLCYFVSIRIRAIKIPILIIAAYFIIKEKSKLNIKIKLMALTFSLILFIAINYVVPQVGLKEVNKLNKEVTLEERFEEIKATYNYTENSEIQKALRRYTVDNPQIKFIIWVYDNKNIPIKDYKWLWAESDRELDVYWCVSNENDYSEAYVKFNKTGEEYIGVFKRNKDGTEYLHQVIEGKLKVNGWPKSIFDMYYGCHKVCFMKEERYKDFLIMLRKSFFLCATNGAFLYKRWGLSCNYLVNSGIVIYINVNNSDKYQ